MDMQHVYRRHNWAPTPREQSILRALVEKDQEALVTATKNRDHCNELLAEIYRVIATQTTVTAEVEVSHQMAIQLRTSLERCVDIIAAVGDNSGNNRLQDDSKEQMDILHAEKMKLLILQRDHATERITMEINEVKRITREDLDAALAAKEELEAAHATKSILTDDHDRWHAQIIQNESSMKLKLNRLQSIWSVSDNIWIHIFSYLTPYTFDMWSQQSWREAASHRGFRDLLAFIGVCHRWRLIIQSTPQLWQHPCLVIGDRNDKSARLLEYYIEFGKGKFKQVNLTTTGSYATMSDALKSQLRQVESLDSLRCEFTNVRSISAQSWWSFFPPIQELYIADTTGGAQLPTRLCGSVKKIVTRSFALKLQGDTPCLEELRILNSTGRFGRSINVSEIRKILRNNCRRLRVLEVTGGIAIGLNGEAVGSGPHDDALDKLQEARMSLEAIVTLIGRSYRLKNLHKIHITSIGDVTAGQWDEFLESGNHRSNILDLSIASMDVDDALRLIPFISAVKRLRTLELSGESVNPIIQVRLSTLVSHPSMPPTSRLSCLSSLQRLVISSYTGTGEVIVQFIEETQVTHLRHTSRIRNLEERDTSSALFDQYRPFKVDLIECPRIPIPIQLLIECNDPSRFPIYVAS